MEYSKKTLKELRKIAYKTTCVITGKDAWVISNKHIYFKVTKNTYESPSSDVWFDWIKCSRKQLIELITKEHKENEIKEILNIKNN